MRTPTNPASNPATVPTRLRRVATRLCGLVVAVGAAAAVASAGTAAHSDACATPASTASSAELSPPTFTPLAPTSPTHYQELANIDGQPRDSSDGVDRRQFSLSAMSPGYLALLDLAPVYLDVPHDTLVLPPFPANSSAQTRAELDHLLALQASRTPEQAQTSHELAGVYYRLRVHPGDPDWPAMRRNLFHMGRQLGPWFGPDDLPVTADFMARVWSDASYYLWAAKFRFNRIRPYALDPRLQNLETPNFPAYPSGHSGNSYVAAFVYAELLPEYRELFVQNARDMAYSREILGVHFASDSESGRLFARAVVDRLLQEPKFREDLETARREILAARHQARAVSATASR